MTSYLATTKSLFVWQKPDTLDDLDQVLNEPPPAPGAPVGVSYPEFTPAEVDAAEDPLPVSSSCPLLQNDLAAAPQLGRGSPTSAPSTPAPAASHSGWLHHLPGSGLLMRHPSGDAKAVGNSTLGEQPAALPAQSENSRWLHHLPGSGLLQRHPSGATTAAVSPLDSQAVPQEGSPSTSPSTNSPPRAGSPRAAAAAAAAAGWGSYLPSLQWPAALSLTSAVPAAKAGQPPQDRELAPLGSHPGQPGMPGGSAAAAEHAPGHLSAALQHTWHQAGAVAPAVVVSVIGAAVGGVIAGPLGMAIGAKSGAAMMAAGAISGAAAHYATHKHPETSAAAEGKPASGKEGQPTCVDAQPQPGAAGEEGQPAFADRHPECSAAGEEVQDSSGSKEGAPTSADAHPQLAQGEGVQEGPGGQEGPTAAGEEGQESSGSQ